MQRFSRKPLLTALGITVLTISAPVLARPHHGFGGDIAIADVEAKHAEHIATTDTDGNGAVSLAEFLAAKPEGRHGFTGHRGFRGHPGDHPMAGPGAPGPMGPPPFEIDLAAMETSVFGKLDADRSGAIERSEFDHEKIGAAHDQAMREAIFAKLDANADGSLSGDELPNPVARLRALDTNRDGKVTRDERKAGFTGSTGKPVEPAGDGG